MKKKKNNSKIKCFCVGKATELTAKQVGFIKTYTSEGTVDSLVELIVRTLNNKSEKLLYLSSEFISKDLDKKTPSIERRIEAMKKLALKGWRIGLRFDPLIHGKDWKKLYKELHLKVFESLPSESIHSISYGPLRFPKAMFKNIFKHRINIIRCYMFKHFFRMNKIKLHRFTILIELIVLCNIT